MVVCIQSGISVRSRTTFFFFTAANLSPVTNTLNYQQCVSSLSSLTFGDRCHKLCGPHNAPLVEVDTAWFIIMMGPVQFVSPHFEIHLSLSLKLCNLLVRLFKSLEKECFSQPILIYGHSSKFLILTFLITMFHYKEKKIQNFSINCHLRHNIKIF